jgi:hypothetical protein
MEVLQQKKVLVERIVPYLVGAPGDAVQRLLQKSVNELESMLGDAITTKARAEAADRVTQHADEMRRESQREGSFVHACMAVINNRRLSTCDGNRAMLESLLNPAEEPSAKLYKALAEQYPTRFTWDAQQTQQTQSTPQEQRAAFDAFVRENNFSSCEANFELFKGGASLENFAGASQVEKAQYAQEAAEALQKFLIHDATPRELKAEAAHQSQVEHDKAIQVEADRRHQFVLGQQQHYPVLPTTNGNGERIDAAYLRKLSTINYPLFKRLVQKHGSGNVTSRLRGEN